MAASSPAPSPNIFRKPSVGSLYIIAGINILACMSDVGSAKAAGAAFEAFGGTGSSPQAELILNFTNSSSQTLSTNYNQGWWSRTRGHDPSNTNYVTGTTLSGNSYNNFFAFDAAGISPLIVQSATLRVDGGAITGPMRYTLYEVSTPFAVLISSDSGNTPLASQVFDDLYTGTSYGSFDLSSTDSNTWLNFSLNGFGIADINSAIAGASHFLIGGSIFPSPISDINLTQPFFLASSLGVTVNPAFAGGTLRMDQADATIPYDFTVSNHNTNTIDQFGNTSTFSGVFSDTTNQPGNLIISNSGIGGKVIFTGANTYTGSTTISGGATVAINGSMVGEMVVNSGGALQGTGSFGGGVINAGGVLAPGNSVGTITSNGNLTFATGSIYAIEIDDSGASDKTIVNGVATLQGGAVAASVSIPGLSALPRTRYAILTATNGVSGRFGNLTGLPILSFLSPTLSYSANDVTLDFVLTPFSTVARNGNQRSVGNALTRAALGPVNAFGAPILNALFLGNHQNAQAVMDTVSGSGLAGVQSTAMQVGAMASSAVSDQIGFWRSGETQDATGITSREGARNFLAYAPVKPEAGAKFPIKVRGGSGMALAIAPRTFRAWGVFFGGAANYLSDPGRGSAASTLGYYGGLMGVDYQIQPNLLVGLALGGSSANFNAGSLSTSGDLTGFHAGLYGAFNLGESYVAVNETFSGYDNLTTRKAGGYSLLPYEQLNARFGSTEFRTRVEGGHSWSIGGLKATPFVAAEFAVYQSDAFTERNSLTTFSTFALRNDGQVTNSLPTFLGLRLSNGYTLANGWRLTPTGSIAYVHEFFPQREFTNVLLSMPGADFTVSGPRSTHNLVQTKIGAHLNLTHQLALFTDFQGEFSSMSQSYGGKAGMKYAW